MKFFLLLSVFLSPGSCILAQSSSSLIPYRDGTHWGYMSVDKKIAIPPTYDSVLPFHEGAGIVLKGENWGMINSVEKVIVPLEPQLLVYIGPGVFIRMVMEGKDAKMGLIDTAGRQVLPTEYDLLMMKDRMVALSKGYLNGLADLTGKVRFPPEYSDIEIWNDSLCILQKDNNYAMYTLDGRQLTPFKYMVLRKYACNRAVMRVGDLFGMLDLQCREIALSYDLVFPFSEGYAMAMKNNKYGTIDTMGKVKVPFVYDQLGDADLGVIAARKGGQWGLIDLSGKELTSFEYENMIRAWRGIIGVKKNGKWAVMAPSGKLLTQPVFDTLELPETNASERSVRDFGQKSLEYDEGYALVGNDGKYGIVDRRGRLVIPPVYDFVSCFMGGIAFVEKEKKWAMADSTGAIKTPFKYDDIGGQYLRHRTHAWVFAIDRKFGLLDGAGREIVPPTYDYYKPADDDYMLVWKDKKMGVIDRKGKVILPAKYDKISFSGDPLTRHRNVFMNGLCQVVLNGVPGFVSKDGTEYFK